ncbi:MAG: efflux RND transporter periplasmic adaptor subunit [Acidobacteriota bacterium]|jgi:membrane fusion protein (multidrug efflux system)
MNPLRRRARTLSLALALSFVLTTAGCGDSEPAPAAPAPPAVSVVTLEPRPITLTTELPGRTSPYLVAEIRPQVNGLIQEREFSEGADVRAGSVLYQIDPAPYQAAYDRAEAALEVARASLPALASRAERMRELASIRAAGEQEAEDAEAALRQAEANVTAAEAALEAARVDLARTPIEAPISGRIGRSAVTIGALVTAFQPTPLAVIQQLDPIYVDVTQSTAELLRLRRALAQGEIADAEGGSSVRLLLEDGTPYPLDGRLEFRDVTVDPGTGSVTLRMVFPNPEHVLLPGMYVRAVVREGVVEDAILAPQQGITRDPKGHPLAWVVGPDDTVELRHPTLGRALGDDWLVTDGLAAGDRLVVEQSRPLQPGVTVRPTPLADPAGPDDPAPDAG